MTSFRSGYDALVRFSAMMPGATPKGGSGLPTWSEVERFLLSMTGEAVFGVLDVVTRDDLDAPQINMIIGVSVEGAGTEARKVMNSLFSIGQRGSSAFIKKVGSTWTIGGLLYVGRYGSGVLNITGGGLVSVGETLTIDYDEDGDGFINMGTGGMLALYDDEDASGSLLDFLGLVDGTDDIQLPVFVEDRIPFRIGVRNTLSIGPEEQQAHTVCATAHGEQLRLCTVKISGTKSIEQIGDLGHVHRFDRSLDFEELLEFTRSKTSETHADNRRRRQRDQYDGQRQSGSQALHHEPTPPKR